MVETDLGWEDAGALIAYFGLVIGFGIWVGIKI